MKLLYGARNARQDVLKACTELCAYVSKWTRACDIKTHRMFCYIAFNLDLVATLTVGDPPSSWELVLYCDADLCGEKAHTRSTSGNALWIEGPNTSALVSFAVTTQSATSESTPESELVSLDTGVKKVGLPALDFWEVVLKRPLKLKVREDNESCIKIVENGYSPAMRHIHRTHRVHIGWLHEVLTGEHAFLEKCISELMKADPFTKSIPPAKWEHALSQFGMTRRKP